MLDETNTLFAETVRAYARAELKPNYSRWESEPVPRSLITDLGKLGVLGLLVPETHGGSEAGFVPVGVAAEELSRGDFNANNLVQLAAISALAVGRWGTDAVKDEWLPAIASGEAIGCLGLSEPHAGSDAAAISTKAVRTESGWLISGEKVSMTFAGYADFCVVMARTGGAGSFGISAFLVPLREGGAKGGEGADRRGVTRDRYGSVGGTFTARGAIVFDEVEVPEDHLLGSEGSGFMQAMTAFDFNRAVIALGCVGAALESIDETVAYTSQRETFGAPLSSRQAVTQQVAEHYAKLQSARLMAYETLSLADAGKTHSTEAAMAKWMGPAWSVEAIHTCLRLHGWPGYGSDMPFGQRLRDVIGLEIGDGTAEIMKAIVARTLYGKPTHR